MKTIDAARNKWADILSRLGVDRSFLSKKHGPCPMCGGKDRWRFDNKGGNGTWICGQCGAGNGMNLIMLLRGWDFAQAATEIDKIVGNCQKDEQKKQVQKDPRERLRKVQEKLVPITGINPVSIYLKNRGVSPSAELKLHPSMPYYEDGRYIGGFPAMVAKFSGPDGKPLTFHITHLTKHGTKAEVQHVKKVMTPVSELAGGAIRLFSPARIMGIAEGIETAMACFDQTGIPTWASYSATLLQSFVPPPECEHLVIFADNDENFTGQRAAYALANRLAIAGLAVEVRVPETPGTDWADKPRAMLQAQLDKLTE